MLTFTAEADHQISIISYTKFLRIAAACNLRHGETVGYESCIWNTARPLPVYRIFARLELGSRASPFKQENLISVFETELLRPLHDAPCNLARPDCCFDGGRSSGDLAVLHLSSNPVLLGESVAVGVLETRSLCRSCHLPQSCAAQHSPVPFVTRHLDTAS